MTRKSWVQDPVTLELVPKDEYVPPASDAPFIVGDIAPYRSMITGEVIPGRRQHREHLRQHGCIEVGNEKLTPRTPTTARDDVKRDIADIMASKGY